MQNTSGGLGAGGGVYDVYNVDDRILLVGRLNNKRVNVVELDEDYAGTFPLKEDIETESDFDYFASYRIVAANNGFPVSIGTVVSQWQMFEGITDEVRISDV